MVLTSDGYFLAISEQSACMHGSYHMHAIYDIMLNLLETHERLCRIVVDSSKV